VSGSPGNDKTQASVHGSTLNRDGPRGLARLLWKLAVLVAAAPWVTLLTFLFIESGPFLLLASGAAGAAVLLGTFGLLMTRKAGIDYRVFVPALSFFISYLGIWLVVAALVLSLPSCPPLDPIPCRWRLGLMYSNIYVFIATLATVFLGLRLTRDKRARP
jgi:hypothetical protein